jgi:hypothetical protein
MPSVQDQSFDLSSRLVGVVFEGEDPNGNRVRKFFRKAYHDLTINLMYAKPVKVTFIIHWYRGELRFSQQLPTKAAFNEEQFYSEIGRYRGCDVERIRQAINFQVY